MLLLKDKVFYYSNYFMLFSLFFIIFIDVLLCFFLNVHVKYDSLANQLGLLVLYLGLFYLKKNNIIYAFKGSYNAGVLDKFLNAIVSIVFMAVFFCASSLLSYLLVKFHQPLVDEVLNYWDGWLHFSWGDFYDWFIRHEHIKMVCYFFYFSLISQYVFTVFCLGCFGKERELSEFFIVLIISTVLTLLGGGLFPALGAFSHYELYNKYYANCRDFYELYFRGMNVLDLNNLQGIIAMPSFHAVSGILIIYACRSFFIINWLSAVVNVAMILSTPFFGGHYLMDVLGGVLTAFFSIGLKRKIIRSLN